jgi:transposase
MAYSQDLRKRVIATVERGEGSLRQIARRFLVSLSFVTRLLHHYRTTGSLKLCSAGTWVVPGAGTWVARRASSSLRPPVRR